jgi:predicted metal-dependent hydrolase
MNKKYGTEEEQKLQIKALLKQSFPTKKVILHKYGKPCIFDISLNDDLLKVHLEAGRYWRFISAFAELEKMLHEYDNLTDSHKILDVCILDYHNGWDYDQVFYEKHKIKVFTTLDKDKRRQIENYTYRNAAYKDLKTFSYRSKKVSEEEIQNFEPSALHFNSYDELCQYCEKAENFTRKTKLTDILSIIEAAEKYFPIRLNELAEEYGFAKVECRVVLSDKFFGRRCDSGSIELGIDMLCYDKKCREGVFIHELCHTKYPNHSLQFFQLLHSFVDRDYDCCYPNKHLYKMVQCFYRRYNFEVRATGNNRIGFKDEFYLEFQRHLKICPQSFTATFTAQHFGKQQ